MRLTTPITSILLILSVTLVSAKPVAIGSRDVFAPPVLYPHEGTVWIVGQHHNVTWDISNIPVDLTNPIGVIQLRAENLTTPCILAQGFDMRLGRVVVTVPTVTPREDFQLVLLGDSGNFSPYFTITN